MAISKRGWAGVLVLVMLAAATWTALGGRQDFVLVNRTGFAIHELYISSSKTDDWEEDVLGQDVLEDGASVRIAFPGGDKQCLFDVKTVDEDGDEVTWAGIDLCKTSKVTLRPKGRAELE